MTIKILGAGRCRYCRIMYERTQRALDEIHVPAEIERVEEPERIYSYGVLATPVLIMDRTVVAQGKVPPVELLKRLIIGRN